jgi:hypothetical protein
LTRPPHEIDVARKTLRLEVQKSFDIKKKKFMEKKLFSAKFSVLCRSDIIQLSFFPRLIASEVGRAT